jgi:uncharacterized protein (DUF305 family)
MSWKLGAAALALVVVAVGIVVAVASVDDGSEEARQTDGAFISGMIPHHEGAVEMAEIALAHARHPEIEELAREIITAQNDEIEELESIHERLFGEPVGALDHGTLGMSDAEMGMHGDAMMLADARPFDREFIDMMIPHHQGAIRMARVQLEAGEDPELRRLSEAIIVAQSHEIEQMNSWREEWYGEPSPGGGPPREDDFEPPSHEDMGH